jgi:hypothetical protein
LVKHNFFVAELRFLLPCNDFSSILQLLAYNQD